MPDHGLTDRHLDILRSVFKQYAGNIDKVGLFGSRATGKYRPNSDIDMAVHGNISAEDIDRIRTLLDESLLELKADIVAYGSTTHVLLKEHIDEVEKVLFTKADLGKH